MFSFTRNAVLTLGQSAEFAALISAHASHYLEQGCQPSDQLLGDYHASSRNRYNAWMRVITRLKNGNDNTSLLSERAQVLTERILIGELVTRVWAAVMTASDRVNGAKRAEPIARHAMHGHLVCHHQVLCMVLQSPCVSARVLSHIDDLRKRVERWTDLLLGHLIGEYDLSDFAFDDARSREFGEDHLRTAITDPDSEVWRLIRGGLDRAFNLATPASRDDRQVICNIMTAIAPQLCETTSEQPT